jgi:hypothetical protein
MTKLIDNDLIIEDLILEIRGQRVMIDADLARLYGVSTRRLNEQVKRNLHRFPQDFMFELNIKETSELVANCDRFNNTKHSSVSPRAFTEHGALMLASILNSKTAIETSIQIIRAFVRMRNLLASNKELTNKINKLEKTTSFHDQRIREILTIIKKLIIYDNGQSKNKVGFSL